MPVAVVHSARTTRLTSTPLGGQLLNRDGAQRVRPQPRNKSDLPQRSQVVRENGGGTSQREREICGKQFSLSRHRSRQSIEDEVAIDLTGNAYVEFKHELGSRCCRDGQQAPFR